MNIKKMLRPAAPLALAAIMLTTACATAPTAQSTAPNTVATAVSNDTGADTAAVSWPQLDLPGCVTYETTGGTEVVLSGETVTLSEAGTYRITGSLNDGQLIVNVSKDENIHLILDNVSIHSSTGPAIRILSADHTIITLVGSNTLSDGIYDTTETAGAALYSKDDLILNGTGSLNVTGNCQHGILSKDDLYILGGTYVVEAAQDAIRGVDSLTITDGNFTITSGQDALKTSQDEDETCGWMYIGGGTFRITAGDDAVHAETQLRIVDCQMEILTSYEGLEGSNISIEGGNISLYSTDDGVNASGTSTGSTGEMTFGRGQKPTDSTQTVDGTASATAMRGEPGGGLGGMSGNGMLLISGGTLIIDADGDGLDCNGSITMTGGTVTVNGPTSGADGALDYDGTFTATGGTLIATGSSQMAQGTSTDSTQPGILVNTTTNYAAATVITLRDASGNVLLTTAPTKSFNSISLTCPQLTEGETYTLYCGEEQAAEVTISGGLTTSGSTGGMGGMGGHGGMGGTRPDRNFGTDAEAGATPAADGEAPTPPEGAPGAASQS